MVMLLGGLWHGASWNFVIWGGIHGGMLAFERSQGRQATFLRLPRVAQVALTFVIVVFAWVFFRARDLPSAIAYCQSMLGFGAAQPGAGLIAGTIYQPYYLLSVVPRGDCHVGGNSNLGLDPKNYTVKERSNSRSLLGLASRDGNPGLQPVYLFYFLGMADSPYARMTREELAEIEVGNTAISRADQHCDGGRFYSHHRRRSLCSTRN